MGLPVDPGFLNPCSCVIPPEYWLDLVIGFQWIKSTKLWNNTFESRLQTDSGFRLTCPLLLSHSLTLTEASCHGGSRPTERPICQGTEGSPWPTAARNEVPSPNAHQDLNPASTMSELGGPSARPEACVDAALCETVPEDPHKLSPDSWPSKIMRSVFVVLSP